MSYDCWKNDQFAESEFWAVWTLWSKSGFDEFWARFDSYEILKSGRGAENFSGQTGQTGERSGFSSRRCPNFGEACLQIP
jgi:hypothetical protein